VREKHVNSLFKNERGIERKGNKIMARDGKEGGYNRKDAVMAGGIRSSKE